MALAIPTGIPSCYLSALIMAVDREAHLPFMVETVIIAISFRSRSGVFQSEIGAGIHSRRNAWAKFIHQPGEKHLAKQKIPLRL